MTAQDRTGFEPTHSPLYMVMHDPIVHQFIGYLAEKKALQERSLSSVWVLQRSPPDVVPEHHRLL